MEIIDKKTAWEGKFLRSLILTYRDKSGNLRNWEAVERVNCNGIIAVVPVTKAREFLLIRQFRPVVNNFVVEFPAGLNDKDENLIDAARRELIEETGYTSDKFIFLCEGPISSGISTEILSVYLAKDVLLASEDLKKQYLADESENIEIVKTPVSEIYRTLEKLRDNGDFIDIKVYGLIETAKLILEQRSNS